MSNRYNKDNVPKPRIVIDLKKKKLLPKIANILNQKIIEPTFEPSMKILIRITESMLERGSEGKTSLSLGTNLNYARLAKHIVWLEKKGLVKSTIENSKINVGLTEKGRLFASTILK